MKYFKKPVYTFRELPSCIQNEIIRISIIFAVCFVSMILFSIKTRTITYFLYGMIILLLGMLFALLWYLKFAYDKAIFVEGTIIKTENDSRTIKDRVKKNIIKIVRPKYIIELTDGTLLTIVKTSHKTFKVGSYVRIYFTPDTLITTNDNEAILNSSLYTEILVKAK